MDDAFGEARGARGVHDRVNVIRPYLLHRASRGRGQEFTEVDGPCGEVGGAFALRTGDDDALELAQGTTDLLQGRHITVAQYHRFGVGVLDDIRQLLSCERRVEADR